MSRLTAVGVLLVVGVLGLAAVACNGLGSDQDAKDYYKELDGQYTDCFREYSAKYYGDDQNGWLVNEMTGMYLNANSITEMAAVRDLCERSLECPPRDFGRGLCAPSDNP